MSKTIKAPPKSVFARSSRLLGLAAGLAQKELASRLAQLDQVKTRVQQARQVVESLGKLKGAAMKAGQMASMELREYLPPEVVEILAELQDKGTTVEFAEIERIIAEALSPEQRGRLRDISPEPLASASIGQVHRARLDLGPERGLRDVVLKVQFRGVGESIDSDVALIEKISRMFLTVTWRDVDMEGVFAEIRDTLKQETDYLREASNLSRYRDLVRGLPGLRVPEVFPEAGSRQVLVMSYEEGTRLKDWIASSPPPAEREAMAHRVLDLYTREFFEWGFVQTDPNFGNYLVDPRTGELILLDFGAAKEYAPDFRARYIRLLRSVRERRDAEAIRLSIELGLLDPREPGPVHDKLIALLASVLELFDPARQPFDFADQAYVDRTRARLFDLVKSLRYSPPPRVLIFLHRKLAGVYALLKALRVRIDAHSYWERLPADPR